MHKKITDKEKEINISTTYINEFYDDNRPEQPQTTNAQTTS